MLASEMRSKTVSEVVKQSELFEIGLVLVDRSLIYLLHIIRIRRIKSD